MSIKKRILDSIMAQLILKAIVLVFSGAVVLSPFCLTKVTDHELVMISNMGRIDPMPAESGLKWFWPFIDEVKRFDTRPIDYHIDSYDANESDLPPGGKNNSDNEKFRGIGAETKDGWPVGVVTHILYSLDKSKGLNIVQTFGLDDSDEARQAIERRIDVEARHAIQNLVPQFELTYLMTNRDELGQYALSVFGLSNVAPGNGKKINIPKPLYPTTTLNDIGIVIKYISFELDVPGSYSNERMKAARSIERIKTLKNRDKELAEEEEVKKKELALESLAEIENAKSEAEAIRIINDERSKVDETALFIEKWNGVLPSTIASDDFLRIIKPDSK